MPVPRQPHELQKKKKNQYPVIIDVQETTFLPGISSNSNRASLSSPHLEYISISADETNRSDSYPNTRACWWDCLPERTSRRAEQDLMAQGKDERFGERESLRMEAKARRASTESPERASSAMTEFQEPTWVRLTYLSNHGARLGEELAMKGGALAGVGATANSCFTRAAAFIHLGWSGLFKEICI